MKQIKKILFIAFAVVMAMAVLAGCKSGEDEAEGLGFNLNEDGTSLEVLFSNGSAVIVIPDTYADMPVTGINRSAFYGCESTTSVTIPASIKRIAEYAFCNCYNLTDINFNGTIEQWNNIDKEARWDQNAGSYTIHCNDGDIARESLYFTLLEDGTGYRLDGVSNGKESNVVIPDKYNGLPVTIIGRRAFIYNAELTSVTIPNRITDIEEDAFYNCYNLTDINFNGTETQWYGIYKEANWDQDAGSYTIHCKDVDIAAGEGFYFTMTLDGTGYFVYGVSYSKDGNVVIPDTYNGLPVSDIGPYVFSNDRDLTGLTISNSITSIGEEAFYGCTNLTDIYFNGTIEQWNNINKEDEWDSNTGSYTIHCTDGDISKTE